MNIYAVIILLALALEYGLNLTANLLNLRHLDKRPPEELNDIYDEEEYEKSQAYTKTNTRFGLLTSTVNLVILLAFWFTGGFEVLDDFVRSLDLHPLLTGLVFIGILGLGSYLLNLPASIYSTFVIEERFGFNTTTVKTFVLDQLKSMGLSLVLGGPLLAGVLAFFMYTGPYAWLYAWGAVTTFVLILQYVAPRYIMPLFNEFKPLEDDSLRDAILNYLEKVSFPVEGLYKMDGSKRSTKSNAFFAGFGQNKRIALFDTLIENHSTDELVAIVAHEVGHYKKKHIIQNMVISVIHTGVLFLLLSVFLDNPGLFEAFYLDQTSVYAGFVFFGLLYTPVELLLSIPMQLLSRYHEYQADRFAAETSANAPALITGLKKLSSDNLSNLTPHPFYVFLNYSHPPLLHRLRALNQVDTARPEPA